MKELVLEPEPTFRQKEIARQYLDLLEAHIQDLKSGTSERALEIRDFAEKIHLHPVHLSNTIKEATGKSTCSHYEERLLRISKELL